MIIVSDCNMINSEFEEDVSKVWDIAVFLQMIAAFSNDINFHEYSELMIEFYDIVKKSNEEDVKKKLPIFAKKFNEIFEPMRLKYPLKRDYREIAENWNDRCKIDKEIFSNGIMIGWLEEQIDLSNYYKYDFTPYHFKIGLVIHKGRGEIEENFLLQDSFICLVKAKKQLIILQNFAQRQKVKLKSLTKKEFDKETLDSLNTIKYEVSFFSRLAIISFFSFFECFINSIGFDYFYRNKDKLPNNEIEILQGSKNGRFLNLKDKIEKYQKIIRNDSVAQIILSDKKQMREPFKSLFENYEELRNASVHFSPAKSKIWLKPHDWCDKAEDLSKLVIDAANEIWKCCHETDKGPDYLGRLEYNRLYRLAELRENEIRNIEKSL